MHEKAEHPKTIIELLQGKHSEQWRKVGEYEISKLMEHDVDDLVELLKGKHIIGNQWVLAVKNDGNVRARVVAKGSSQKPGTDFDPDMT